MQRIIATLIFLVTSIIHAYALSVTADITSFSCESKTVKFTFDCPFDGQVWVPVPPPMGISYNNAPSMTAPYWDVVNGEISFDIDVNDIGNAGSWNINFLIISSDTTCAVPIVDQASVTLSYDCLGPPNNDCPTATPISIDFNTCSYVDFDTNNTTASGVATSCHNFTFVDLWYSFYANNTTITFEYLSNPGILAYYTLFSSCPSNGGAELSCDPIFNFSGAPGAFTFTVPSINQTYYLQLTYNGVENGTDQSFCLHSTTPPAPCDTQIIVSNTGPNLPSMSYTVSDNIQTSGSAIVSSSGVVYDAANFVQLNAGFECFLDFEVKLDGCVP